MKKHYIVRWLAGSCLVVVLCGVSLTRDDAALATVNAHNVSDAAQVQQLMSGLAVPFEANTGQQDPRVAFTARTFAGTLFVTHTGQLVHSFPGLPVAVQGGRKTIHERGPGWVLTESLIGAHPVVRGDAPSATRVSRFIGNDPKRWQTSVPTFDRVALDEAWPGIDVALVAHGNNVETFFTMAPGVDVGRIAMRVRGAKRLELAADGAIIAHTGNGPVSFTAPRAWQDIKGERQPVRVAYTLAGDHYGFRLSDYDRAYPVVIDPVKQSTYLGGSSADMAYAIALRGNDVYVTGGTSSTPPTFQSTNGSVQPGYGGGTEDAFVIRLNNALTYPIIRATYLGGSGFDQGNGIAVDAASGDVFVTGQTDSSNFPTTSGVLQQTNSTGSQKAFVVRLNGNLNGIVKSTYVGGNLSDSSNAIALDGNHHVFVAGYTSSTIFPGVAGSTQPTHIGLNDGYVARLDDNLSPTMNATFLGGAGTDSVDAMALRGGDVFVTGFGSAPFLPAMNGAQTNYSGMGDVFVVKLDNSLTGPARATYLGGSKADHPDAIALDSLGNVFVTGYTASTDFHNIPTSTTIPTSVVQSSYGGGTKNIFVARLDNSLTNILQATYLGYADENAATGIVLDSKDDVFVTGYTKKGSSASAFPGIYAGAQTTSNLYEAFVVRLKADLSSIVQATYLGDSADDKAWAIALDPNNYVFVAGETNSSPPFPGITGSSAQLAYGGGASDGFVSKLTHGLHDLANSTANDDGDPHITTVSGLHYNFQSAGEFTALRDLPGLEIQTRQSPTSSWGPFFDSYTGLTSCVSVNTALAARVGKHRVTYQPDFKNPADPDGLQLRVDGRLTPLTAAGLNLSGGGRIVQTAGALEIDFPDGTVLIATPYWVVPQWVLNISVYRTDAEEGIMGAVPHASWLPGLPGGASVGPMPAALHRRFVTLNRTYANAWRVSNKTSLFDYARGTSTATFTFPGWPAERGACVVPHSPPPAKPIDLARAREICRPIADKTRNADCVFDVMATGVPDFAKAYLLTQRIQDGATMIDVVDNLPAINARTTKDVPIFTATVARLAAGGKTPIGAVQFTLDGEKAGEPVRLDRGGLARWKAASLKPGEHRLSASYLPDKDSVFLPSSSAEKAVVLRGAR